MNLTQLLFCALFSPVTISFHSDFGAAFFLKSTEHPALARVPTILYCSCVRLLGIQLNMGNLPLPALKLLLLFLVRLLLFLSMDVYALLDSNCQTKHPLLTLLPLS